MKRNLILFLAIISLLAGCQKEFSEEIARTPAKGSLQSDITTECLPKTVGGVYVAGKALSDSNFIDVQIDVTTAGAYQISTDTVNGYAFMASGVFADAGIKTVRLKGKGTPLTAGNNLFVISFDSSFCLVQVAVLPAGAGGPATYTLQGAGAACMNYTVNGTYVKDSILNASNTVTIAVNVTSIGTYTITTNTVNGISFSGSGTLASTGLQNITLTSTGRPDAAGAATLTINAGGSSCTFIVNVSATAVAADYFPRTTNSNWTYEFDGNANDTLFRVVIPPTHSAFGNTYNIFAETDNVASNQYDSSGYYRKSGNNYHEFIDFGSFFNLDNANWMDYIFLKDNVPVNTTWTTDTITGSVSGQQISIRVKFKILQKDVSVTVKGKTYPNTIVVEERIEQLVSGTWTDITSIVGYFKVSYARNVGMIVNEYIGPSGAREGIMELRRHQVL